MKKLTILLAICTFAAWCQAQENAKESLSMSFDAVENQVTAPMDTVPEWVRQRTTPEEYEAWKALSRHFKIDYTVLLYDDLTEKDKEMIYHQVQEACNAVENGTFKGKTGTLFSIRLHPQRPQYTHRWNLEDIAHVNGNLTFYKLSSIVYRSPDRPDKGLEIRLSFLYDRFQKQAQIVNVESRPLGKDDLVNGGCTHRYRIPEKVIEGRYEGTLTYKDESGKVVEENINTTFSLYPDRITLLLPEEVGKE